MDRPLTRQVFDKISEIVALLNSSASLQAFMAEVQQQLASLIYAENIYLALTEPKGKYLTFPFYQDIHNDFSLEQLEAIPLEQLFSTLTFYAMKQKKICVLTEPDILQLVGTGQVKVLGQVPKQWLCFPLIHKEQFFGVFVMQSYRRVDEYQGLVIEMLAAISQVLASALVAFRNHADLLMAHQALAQQQGLLEQQVNERTRELYAKVQQLKAEISLNQQLQSQLIYKAQHDALTGLYNREFLNELLQQPHCLFAYCAFVDLDGFKAVNDEHGHHCGDLLLVIVAGLLRQSCREDELAIRNGGDEFILLLRRRELVEVRQLLEQLLAQISAIDQVGEHRVKIGASIGLSVNYAKQSQSSLALSTLLSRADNAMYQAKQAGKQQYQIAHLQ